MRIQGLGVIEDAVVELAPGFTVVTGETGAGKTMVVTGLGLLFGGRADAGLVRNGTGKALVEGRLSVPADSPAGRRAAEAGAEVDDGELLLARTVSAEGRSRAHVGGRAAPIGLLTDLADDLIAVHGQTDQQRLLRPARQRGALDRYAGEAVSAPLKAYGGVYRRLREVSAELTEITTRARERAQEADLLRFGLTEIEQVVPQPGEDAELAAETLRLGHADALRTAATTAHEALLGDPETGTDAVDASTLLGAAHRAVEAVRAHDPALAALADRLGEVGYLVSDVAGELASYAAGVDADPVRLAAAEERRAALSALTRKYGESIDEVLAWAERSAARLAELDGDDDRTEELTAERDALRGELATLASEVSAARHAAAERFAAAVTGELTALAMPYARVGVAISGVDDPDGLPVGDRVLAYGPMGVDEVELQLSPHPGAPPRPLAKGASGGELSRVMLAVEVVFAGADPVPTFVFDEVDQGVGGKAAVEVGRRLARLARVAQVIVVTHLPQVAAFADRHLVVEKSSDGTVTRSGVVSLDDAARVRELSRMLAGLEDSELGRAHAEELLATAAGAKRED
ncbi:DNA repair protein RecN [Embleya sp. NPDC050493]|uniref:DNA repair protein RecN n=1 Tax=Embleya sp. NPDC050493 TaxID=3363989 RepID=UPI00378AE50A